jgi:hypothetical protein
MKFRVLNYINQFGSITTWEAIKELGCTRLSEYIRQLRQELPIEDEWVESINRYGEKVQYKRYWIEEKKEKKSIFKKIFNK